MIRECGVCLVFSETSLLQLHVLYMFILLLL